MNVLLTSLCYMAVGAVVVSAAVLVVCVALDMHDRGVERVRRAAR